MKVIWVAVAVVTGEVVLLQSAWRRSLASMLSAARASVWSELCSWVRPLRATVTESSSANIATSTLRTAMAAIISTRVKPLSLRRAVRARSFVSMRTP